MKTWIKCVVLVLSSIISFVMLYVALYIGIEAITGGLNYPATASLPILGMLTATVALILFSVWCFVYTKENKRKGLGLTAVIFGAVAVLAFFISPIVNSTIGDSDNITVSRSTESEISVRNEYNWYLDFGEFVGAESVTDWEAEDSAMHIWIYKKAHVSLDKLQQYVDCYRDKGFRCSKSEDDTGQSFTLSSEEFSKVILILYPEEGTTVTVYVKEK